MIAAMYFLLMGLTCILLVAVAPITDYYLKPEFMLSNGYVMAIGLVLTAMFCLIAKKESSSANKLEKSLTKHTAKILPICTVLLFAAEVVFVSGGFFYSDWDPAGVLDAVYKIMHHDQMAINADYFSAHPNNLMLVWIYVIVLKIASIFGTESVLAISVFQCLLFSVTGVLVFQTVCRVFRSTGASFPYIASWITWIIYAAVVGMSPWLIITYSDQVGLIFPVLILNIAVRMRYRLPEEKGQDEKDHLKKIGAWGLIGVLSAIGYSIKPQTVIVTIAVIMVELVHFFALLFKGKKEVIVNGFRHGAKNIVLSLLFFCVFMMLIHFFIVKAVYPSLGIPLNSDKEFGMPHYIMMGLNPETDGVYSNDDTNFTNELPRPERGRKNMEVARKRLDEYGTAGFIRHLFRKAMINFGDGTFAWGIDGNFFAGTDFGNMPYVSSNSLTPHILAWIQVGAEHNALFSMIEQGMWLTILALSLLAGLPAGGLSRMLHSKNSLFNKEESEVVETSKRDFLSGGYGWFRDVVLLSLLGLFIFELIFEAKARYLFIYVPFWIIAAVLGIFAQMPGKSTAG